jgi:hypothetical protein
MPRAQLLDFGERLCWISVSAVSSEIVKSIDRLGGLLHEYRIAA